MFYCEGCRRDSVWPETIRKSQGRCAVCGVWAECHDCPSSALPAPPVAGDPARPDDIRAAGWVVAVHNDYRQDGVAHTFWLFTKNDRCVRGEGRTDTVALNAVRETLGLAVPSGAKTLDRRELGTVLAGVRLLQEVRTTGKLPDVEKMRAINDIQGDGIDCLTPEDMDELCDRLNRG